MALLSSTSVTGTGTVVFDDRPTAKVRYRLNGFAVPSVTTFIKAGLPTSEQLINWKIGKAAEFVLDHAALEERPPREEILKLSKVAWKKSTEEAQGVGVAIHSYAELSSLGKHEEAMAELQKSKDSPQWDEIISAAHKVDEFMAQNRDTILFTEAIVASSKHGFAGRFDRLVHRTGMNIMSDYKTSKYFYVEQFIQDAAYSIAVAEWLNIKVDAFEVIRFGKQGGDFKRLLISDKEEVERLKQQALRCLDTYNEMKFWSKDERFKYAKS